MLTFVSNWEKIIQGISFQTFLDSELSCRHEFKEKLVNQMYSDLVFILIAFF